MRLGLYAAVVNLPQSPVVGQFEIPRDSNRFRFCSIRTLLIDDSKSDEQCSSGQVAHTCLIFGRHQRKTAERSFHRYLHPPSVVPFSISSFWAFPILMPLKPTSSSHRVPVEEVSEALDQRMGSDLR
jgi:hypothetical protein